MVPPGTVAQEHNERARTAPTSKDASLFFMGNYEEGGNAKTIVKLVGAMFGTTVDASLLGPLALAGLPGVRALTRNVTVEPITGLTSVKTIGLAEPFATSVQVGAAAVPPFCSMKNSVPAGLPLALNVEVAVPVAACAKAVLNRRKAIARMPQRRGNLVSMEAGLKKSPLSVKTEG